MHSSLLHIYRCKAFQAGCTAYLPGPCKPWAWRYADGTVESESRTLLELEDVARRYRHPSIIDVKVSISRRGSCSRRAPCKYACPRPDINVAQVGSPVMQACASGVRPTRIMLVNICGGPAGRVPDVVRRRRREVYKEVQVRDATSPGCLNSLQSRTSPCTYRHSYRHSVCVALGMLHDYALTLSPTVLAGGRTLRQRRRPWASRSAACRSSGAAPLRCTVAVRS